MSKLPNYALSYLGGAAAPSSCSYVILNGCQKMHLSHHTCSVLIPPKFTSHSFDDNGKTVVTKVREEGDRGREIGGRERTAASEFPGSNV